MIQLTKTEYLAKLAAFNIALHGDGPEKENFAELGWAEYGIFWQNYVAPLTKRLILPVDDPKYIRPRLEVGNDVEEISRHNYAIFTRLFQAKKCLNRQGEIPYEEFYVKMSSVCDLVEDFLLKIYLLHCELTAQEPKIIKSLSKDDFFKLCSSFYETDYPMLHEHYIAKGKFISLKVPNGGDIVAEFLKQLTGNNSHWLSWRESSTKIKQYRNYFVHKTLVVKVSWSGRMYVPRRNKLSEYSDYRKAENVHFPHFVESKQIMAQDFAEILEHVRELWQLVIATLEPHKISPILMKKFDINLAYP